MSIQLVVSSTGRYFKEYLHPRMLDQVLPKLREFAKSNKFPLGEERDDERDWSVDLFSDSLSLATEICHKKNYHCPEIFYMTLYYCTENAKPSPFDFEFHLSGEAEKDIWGIASVEDLRNAIRFLSTELGNKNCRNMTLLRDTISSYTQALSESDQQHQPIFVNC